MTPQPAAGGGMFLPVAAAALLWLMLPSCAASRADLGADGLVPGGLRSGSVRTIVAFGDSVVQGWHASEGWPSILGRRLVAGGQAVEVFNTGRTGDTALDGLSRLDGDVLSKDPDLVLLAFGLNDMRKRIPPHRFKETLKLLCRKVRQHGASPAILTTIRLSGKHEMEAALEAYNKAAAEAAGEEKALLIDVYGLTAGQAPPIPPLDRSHPDDEGQSRLAEIVYRALLP